jgi:hypothetical protein
MTTINFEFVSTMLPVQERYRYAIDVDDDIVDSAKALKDLCDSHKNAVLRIDSVSINDGDEVTQPYVNWFINLCNNKHLLKNNPEIFSAAIILAARYSNDKGIAADGMLLYGAYYAVLYADSDIESFVDSCNEAVCSGEFSVVFDKDESTAYEEYAKEDESGDVPESVFEHVDWEAVGRKFADGGLRDWDGDFAVWKEWH